MAYADKTLVCRDCGEEFIFTQGEQEFYASKGLVNEPKRCPNCRQQRKGSRSGGDSERANRPMYEVICDDCGQTTTVPFQPRGDRPVYCSDCYQKHRSESYGHEVYR